MNYHPMGEDKKPVEIKLNAEYIDIYENIIITPETDIKDLEELFRDLKEIKLEQLGGIYYRIEAKNIPISEVDSIHTKIDNLKRTIRDKQISIYDKTNVVKFPTSISSFFAKMIVETNKKSNYDKNKVYMTLRSIFLNLYEHPETGIEAVREEDIEKLLKATISTNEKDAITNIEDASVGLVSNISKLIVSWIFDQLCIPILNYKTDKKEIPYIQENNQLIVDGTQYEKIKLPTKYMGDIHALYDPVTNTIKVFNLGKEKFGIIFPFIFLTQVDQIVFHIRIEIFKIIKESMERVMREILHNLDTINIYDDIKVEDLKNTKEGMVNSVEFFYRLSTELVNKAKKDNMMIKYQYRRDHFRVLANQILSGSVSNKIIKMTPLILFDDLDNIVKDLELLSVRFSGISNQISNYMGELIEAKKAKNPEWYQKTLKGIRDFIKDVLVDLIDKKTGGS